MLYCFSHSIAVCGMGSLKGMHMVGISVKKKLEHLCMAYLKWVELFFMANSIANDKKIAVFF